MARCCPSIIDPAAMRFLRVLLPACERRTHGRPARKAKTLHPVVPADWRRVSCLGADNKAAALRAFRKTCLAQVELCPGSPMKKQSPLTVWEKPISLALAKPEPVCDGVLGRQHACLPLCRNFRKEKQQGLVIRHSCRGQNVPGFFGLTRRSKDTGYDISSAWGRASRPYQSMPKGRASLADRNQARASAVKPMSARAAKNTFGMMMDIALAVSALIEKHGRGIVMIMSVEEYE